MRLSTNITILKLLMFILMIQIVVFAVSAKNGQALNSMHRSSNESQIKSETQADSIRQNPVSKFIHDLDSKKNFRYLLIIIFLIFILMLFFPFSAALREWTRKKDNMPLFVDLEYSKDPRFFDHSFRSKLLANVSTADVDRCFRIKLSGKEELIEMIEGRHVDRFKFGNHILFLEGDAQIKNNMKFSKEVYVTGITRLQDKTRIRAMLSEKDLYLGKKCKVIRWIGSEENIYTSSGCDLGVRCSCQKTLDLAENCTFKSLYGHPVQTGYSLQKPESAVEKISASKTEKNSEPELQNLKDADPKIFKQLDKPLYETVTFQTTEDDEATIADASLLAKEDELILPPNTRIEKDLIVKTRLLIGAGCRIGGSIRCYGDVLISRNSEIQGNIFSDNNIRLENNCRVWGNVFCQEEVRIAAGCEIGSKFQVKSVIGKKSVVLSENVIIYGYVLTEGTGNSV